MKTCFRCGQLFTHKSNLNRHLLKKSPCPTIYMDVAGEDILNNFVYYQNQYTKGNFNIVHKSAFQEPELKHEIEIEDEDDEFDDFDESILYQCEGCNKIFKHRNNYYRHKKSNCSVLKSNYKELKCIKKKLDNTYRQLKKEKEDYTPIEIITPEIESIETSNVTPHKLESLSPTKTSGNNFDNSLNTYTTNAHNFELKQHTRDIINKNEFNITINDYGNEDISGVSDGEWKEIMKKLYYALPDLVRKVHFDIETNRNVYVPNIREKYAMVWKNNQWEMMDIKDVLDDLLINNTDRIYDFLEDNIEMLGDNLHSKMNDIVEKISNNKKLQKKYQDQIKMILINNRNIVKKTFEAEFGKKLTLL